MMSDTTRKVAIAALLAAITAGLTGCSTIDAQEPTSDAPVSSQGADAGIDIRGDFDRLIGPSPGEFIRMYESKLGAEGYESLPELIAAATHVQSIDRALDQVENLYFEWIDNWYGDLAKCEESHAEILDIIAKETWEAPDASPDLAKYLSSSSFFQAERFGEDLSLDCGYQAGEEAKFFFINEGLPISQEVADALRYFQPEGWEDLLIESNRLALGEMGYEADEKSSDESGDSSGTSETTSQANAKRLASDYIRLMPFSRKGLINQLEFEGFSTSDAEYGVDATGTNWRNQAVKMAANYLDLMAFSKQSLIDQLVFEGFSEADSTYAVEQNGF